MLGNKKPKGDGPKSPPPPPIKPQEIYVDDRKITIEEVASRFSIPKHLLADSGSFCIMAEGEIQSAFIKRLKRRLRRIAKHYEKGLAELEKKYK